MPYKPKPIDTSKVALDNTIAQLSELLARNVHEHWAQQRMAEGWKLGSHRDDGKKEHPSLIPFEALSESEKQYDRNTAMETLKAILALGFTIQPPGQVVLPPSRPLTAEDNPAATILRHLQSTPSLTLTELLGLFRSRDEQEWAHTPEVYAQLGQRILRLGEPLLAYDVVTAGLKSSPRDARLLQLQALALARTGASGKANAILLELEKEGHCDAETLGILARTYKDLGLAAGNDDARKVHFGKAAEVYGRAYESTGDYWTGINAATMALLVGDRDKAAMLASEVRSKCLQKLEQAKGADDDAYWTLATLGEAALVRRELTEAADWYGRAFEANRGRYGDLQSTRRNVRLILECLGLDQTLVENWLRIPTVVAFAGTGDNGLLTPESERTISQTIRNRLDQLKGGFGYVTAGCGLNVLFAEAILERGGELCVVLPYRRENFLRDAAASAFGPSWAVRLERALDRAARVVTASEHKLEIGDISLHYANQFVLGLAGIRAAQLGTTMVPLTLGEPAVRTSERAEQFGARTMAMLFADAVGFSKLGEPEIPKFVRHFLGAVAGLIARSSHGPVLKSTWGDGLYFVFKSVSDAASFALDLSDLINQTNWSECGLPSGLSLRIALHAGPVYECHDPVSNQTNFTGNHVTRAARMEPITPPGEVYASQAFAALAAAEGAPGFACDYAGQTPLPKGYGMLPTYHLRRHKG
ncbi:MAG: TRAFs-binding domain-containing protein [Verrucomicrobiia bacterium]